MHSYQAHHGVCHLDRRTGERAGLQGHWAQKDRCKSQGRAYAMRRALRNDLHKQWKVTRAPCVPLFSIPSNLNKLEQSKGVVSGNVSDSLLLDPRGGVLMRFQEQGWELYPRLTVKKATFKVGWREVRSLEWVHGYCGFPRSLVTIGQVFHPSHQPGQGIRPEP